jgi:plastocyanin
MTLHATCARPRRPWRTAVGALLLVGIVPLAGCAPTAAATISAATGLSTPVPPAALATIPPAKPPHPVDTTGGPAVGVENFNFTPADLTVAAGTTVVWTNHDDVDHTVTASDNSFSSPSIATDGQFSHTFATPGTYSYFCAIHPFMSARVIVQ